MPDPAHTLARPWTTPGEGVFARPSQWADYHLLVGADYTLAVASHSSKLGPVSFAPGLGSAAPSA
jgi:hypothetical protein